MTRRDLGHGVFVLLLILSSISSEIPHDLVRGGPRGSSSLSSNTQPLLPRGLRFRCGSLAFSLLGLPTPAEVGAWRGPRRLRVHGEDFSGCQAYQVGKS